MHTPNPHPSVSPFAQRLAPAPRSPAFADPNWWTWCGSVLPTPDGRYHLYASRWPRHLPFFNGYLAASRIVYAVAANPLGPFVYQHDVFAPHPARWDASTTHNPAILPFAGRFYLFYIGLRYDHHPPLTAPFPEWRDLYRRFRIGVAVADRPEGPFTPADHPTIDTTVAPWPHLVTTNPAPLVTPEGRIRVYYRTPRQEGDRVRNVLAVAEAPHPLGPYRSLSAEPLLPPDRHLEDPHVWHNGTVYEAIAKDLDGNTAGQIRAAVHLWSPDGLTWHLAPHPTAYTRTLHHADAPPTPVGNLERPWLLRDSQGTPTILYAAASDHEQGFHHATRTWLQAIPLTPAAG